MKRRLQKIMTTYLVQKGWELENPFNGGDPIIAGKQALDYVKFQLFLERYWEEHGEEHCTELRVQTPHWVYG